MKTYHADAFTILPTLEKESFDAVITDPPYCSGGEAAKRWGTKKHAAKYVRDATKYPDFDDGNRDRLAHYYWTCDCACPC